MPTHAHTVLMCDDNFCCPHGIICHVVLTLLNIAVIQHYSSIIMLAVLTGVWILPVNLSRVPRGTITLASTNISN